MIGVRSVLNALAVAFTTYLAVGAMLWTRMPAIPVLHVAAIVLFLLTTWVCIFWKNGPLTGAAAHAITGDLGRPPLLPPWAAVIAVATAAVVPSVTWVAAGDEARLDSFATWSLGGVGALMTIVMVRGRPWAAWSGIVFLAVAATAWIGLPDALALGLVGAVLWVGVAQLMSWLVDRAARDTAQLADLQRAASEWLASQDGMRWERRTGVQRALAVAGPVLVRTVESGGALDDDERTEARIAEGSLRDDLRGPALLDEDVRGRIAAARRRGAAVTVLDEGGLDGLDEADLDRIRSELARILDEVRSARVYIRASTDERVAVTVVGRPAAGVGEDEVDLWQEIERHRSSD